MGLLIVVVTAFLLSILAPYLHRWLKHRTGYLLAIHPILTFAWLMTAASRLPEEGAETLQLAWAPALGLSFSMTLDGLSLLMGLLISGIGALVILYGGEYLHDHPGLPRFYCLILIFMGAMLGVVFSANALLLFIFWEATSISSFLLIGFDHQREEARKAAWQALLITAGGGLALMAGFVLLAVQTGTFEISAWIAAAGSLQSQPVLTWAFLLVLLGAATKSAQFPFHFWLPNAMQAPTPVSAYLHSATMVKAGIFLLARLFPLFGGLPIWQPLVTALGGLTMLAGALLALGQTDLKRLLAYSTVGALGILTMLLGIGTPLALKSAMVFLLAHGMYKGALFLAAGSIDHGAGTREITRLGGLNRAMPFTAAGAVVAALSMAGIPPLFGFISKELFYETSLAVGGWSAALTVLGVVSNAAFAAVAGWVGVLPFWKKPVQALHAHESPALLWLPPLLLAGAGLALGLLPALAGDWVITPALAALTGVSAKAKLALWHGLNPMLGLSALTILAGAGIYLAASRLQPFVHAFWHKVNPISPSEIYHAVVKGFIYLANWQTRLLQNGYLRVYILVIILTTFSLVLLTFFLRGGAFSLLPEAPPRFYDVLLVLIILIAAVLVTRTQSRLATIALLGAIGFSIGILFLLYSAPDLAMVQFAIETLTVILFVLVISRLPKFTRLTSRPARLLDVLVAIAGGAMMTMLMLLVSAHPSDSVLAGYFAENSLTLANGRNIVNVILVDFRALDTLGEITVLAVAAIGVFALIRFTRREAADRSKPNQER